MGFLNGKKNQTSFLKFLIPVTVKYSILDCVLVEGSAVFGLLIWESSTEISSCFPVHVLCQDGLVCVCASVCVYMSCARLVSGWVSVCLCVCVSVCVYMSCARLVSGWVWSHG